MGVALQVGQSSGSESQVYALSTEVEAWLDELRRLIDEAAERLVAGQPLPALSSLVAVPPLHRMLVERCSALLEEGDAPVADGPDVPCGLYL